MPRSWFLPLRVELKVLWILLAAVSTSPSNPLRILWKKISHSHPHSKAMEVKLKSCSKIGVVFGKFVEFVWPSCDVIMKKITSIWLYLLHLLPPPIMSCNCPELFGARVIYWRMQKNDLIKLHILTYPTCLNVVYDYRKSIMGWSSSPRSSNAKCKLQVTSSSKLKIEPKCYSRFPSI